MSFLKIKGNAYTVIDKSSRKFRPGEIVVAIEDDPVPYCVGWCEYREDFTLLDYKKYDLSVDAFIEDEDLRRSEKYDHKKRNL